MRWPREETVMTREPPEVEVLAEERRRSLRRLKRRKWERWLVANWVSKPSTVLPWGVAMTLWELVVSQGCFLVYI
jgi:hypothetical protein